MSLVDTHCHLDLPQFDEDRDGVVERALAAGVARIIIPAIDLEGMPTILSLAERYAGVYAAVGVHPNSTREWRESWLDEIRDLARHPKVVAIGEIGLDYHWDRSPHETQQLAFDAQLALAAELSLPVIIHNREATNDVMRHLRRAPQSGREGAGVLHAYSANWLAAMEVMVMGFYIGFTGAVTYKSADELRSIAARVPIDRVLVETDAPYLAPEPHRGDRNEPAMVADVAARLVEIRGADPDEFAAQTTANAERLFRLPSP